MNRLTTIAVLAVVGGMTLGACGPQSPESKGKEGVQMRQSPAGWDTPGAGWTIRDYQIETEHPYRNDHYGEITLSEPGATALRIRFDVMDLETGYDVLRLYDGDGGLVMEYTGELEDFWSVEIPGDTARLVFTTDYSVTRYGIVIDQYAFTTQTDVWDTHSFLWSTPGDVYPNDHEERVDIHEAGAQKLKIHFDRFDTEAGYDTVRIYDKIGRRVAEYSGDLGSFTTPAFAGDELSVIFHSDFIIQAAGVGIDNYSFVAGNDDCFCTMQYDPVCGTNGFTYGNACMAGCAGVPVAHHGACGTDGDFCGGLMAKPCATGYSCKLDGDWPDAGGVCVK